MFMTLAERNKKILEAIETATKRAMASKELARATLIAEGIYTEDGELAPEFGGKVRKAKIKSKAKKAA